MDWDFIKGELIYIAYAATRVFITLGSFYLAMAIATA